MLFDHDAPYVALFDYFLDFIYELGAFNFYRFPPGPFSHDCVLLTEIGLHALRGQPRTSLVPFRRLLVCMCQCDDSRLREMGTADLKTDRQTGKREAARNGDC